MLNDKKLKITSPSFENNCMMPKKHTGFVEDISPAFKIENMSHKAVSIAIIMDDLDVVFSNEYNHWCIWNIPKTNEIAENIPYGKTMPILEEMCKWGEENRIIWGWFCFKFCLNFFIESVSFDFGIISLFLYKSLKYNRW